MKYIFYVQYVFLVSRTAFEIIENKRGLASQLLRYAHVPYIHISAADVVLVTPHNFPTFKVCVRRWESTRYKSKVHFMCFCTSVVHNSVFLCLEWEEVVTSVRYFKNQNTNVAGTSFFYGYIMNLKTFSLKTKEERRHSLNRILSKWKFFYAFQKNKSKYRNIEQ